MLISFSIPLTLSITEGVILEAMMRGSSTVHKDHSGAIGSAIFLFP